MRRSARIAELAARKASDSTSGDVIARPGRVARQRRAPGSNDEGRKAQGTEQDNEKGSFTSIFGILSVLLALVSVCIESFA